MENIEEKIQTASSLIARVNEEMAKVIVGQHDFLTKLWVALLCKGHVLIEGVPGLAKTLAVTTLARVLDLSFHRIQFTPDLLPADVTGTLFYNHAKAEFTARPGPIFANLVLADEINRASAKVQSALLEGMQERQVTLGSETRALPDPFMVLATQNPIEQRGTYPLPEAQLDRFMMKLQITYPKKIEELTILRRMAKSTPSLSVETKMMASDLLRLRALVDEIYMDEKIEEYIVSLVDATRHPQNTKGIEDLEGLLLYGASPRASIYLTMAARAYAFLMGRGYVLPQDVKEVGLDILRHRVILSYEAQAEEKSAEDILQRIFDEVDVP